MARSVAFRIRRDIPLALKSLAILATLPSVLGACGGPRPGTQTARATPPTVAVPAVATLPKILDDPPPGTPSFSFDDRALPSLADVINDGKFKQPGADGQFILTNVDPSFSRFFTMLHDEKRDVYLIRDQANRLLFEGRIDGVPRYVAGIDLDADGQQDVLIDVAAYGNHGNGRESFVAYLNDGSHLAPLENAVHVEYDRGQEDRAGRLTWYAASAVTAIFVGEELVPATTADGAPTVRYIKEIWGHKNGSMNLISQTPTARQTGQVKHLTFR